MAVDSQVQSRLAGHLNPGEVLRWTGRPDPVVYARGGFIAVAMGVICIMFAIAWLHLAIQVLHSPVVHIAGALLFLIAGVVLTCLLPWYYVRAQRVVYAVTTQRVIMLTPTLMGVPQLLACVPSDIARQIKRHNGGGDILLHSANTNRLGRRTLLTGLYALTDIRDASLYITELIRRTQSTPADENQYMNITDRLR